METETLLAGRYRLGPRVGSGGMADVHRATDELLGREVAVKVLRCTDGDRDRFATEACTVAALNHPGIVTVLDAGLDEDQPYLVMELVEGPTLAQALGDGPIDPGRVRAIGQQVAAALAYAHARGVVHRDVKPGNILLRADGTVLLADFGIALMLDGPTVEPDSGLVVGSPAYVAPEQVAAEEVGPPADVYSLGLVLFEALTGRRAFAGTGVEMAYARVRSAPEIPVSLGPTWVGTLSGMTVRPPAGRPSAATVARLLATPPHRPDIDTVAFTPLTAPSRRRLVPRALVVGAATVAATVVLVGFADGTDRAVVVPPVVPKASAVARHEPVRPAEIRTSPRPVAVAAHPARHPHRTHDKPKKRHGKGHKKHRHR